MAKVHHYMVDYLDDTGNVAFANATELTSLTEAKSLASKTSKQHDTGAYVVAFEKHVSGIADSDVRFHAVGHISFFDGKQSETDGVVI